MLIKPRDAYFWIIINMFNFFKRSAFKSYFIILHFYKIIERTLTFKKVKKLHKIKDNMAI